MINNNWFKVGNDKMMQAAFWGWWEGVSEFRKFIGQYTYKVTDEGLFIKVPEKVIVTLVDLCQELTEM